MSVNPFAATSRYYTTETAELVDANGKTIVYMRRRWVPRSDSFTMLYEHTVVEGDRVDNVAAEYVGDPEQFWRLCDANDALRPAELTDTLGRVIRVTLPEGIAGNGDA